MAPNSSTSEALALASITKKTVNLHPVSIRVENKIYCAKKLSSFHPGGPLFLNSFSGTDATEAFLTYHRRRFPHSVAKPALEYAIDDDSNTADNLEMSRDYLDLCERVNKVLPRAGGFATWTFFAKATFIMVSCISLEMYMHWTGNYRWWISSLVGWFHALISFSIQHDANHGAISKKPWVNSFWGYSMSWMGGSRASWIHQHNVQHHVHTNDVRKDPDIWGKPVLRLNSTRPLFKFQAFQQIYFFALILLFGSTFTFASFTSSLSVHEFTPISPLLSSQCRLDVVWSLLYFFRWYFFPLYQKPSVWTLLNCIPVQIVLGWLAAYFSIINHNYEGVVQMNSEGESKTRKSLMYKQVATSCNVGGPIMNFMHGGLNYQIEHHLFPRICSDHYPTIAPIVKEFCEERGYPYKHFSTLWEITGAFYRHLFDLGNKEVPKSSPKVVFSTDEMMS